MNDYNPYETKKELTESEIIQDLKRKVQLNATGLAAYEVTHIKILLQIIERQQKEIRHCEKYLNRLIMWKNKFWLSIMKIENSGYHRKLGLQGKRMLGYSIRLRVLGKEII